MTKAQQVHQLRMALALLRMIPSLQPGEGIEARKDAEKIIEGMIIEVANS